MGQCWEEAVQNWYPKHSGQKKTMILREMTNLTCGEHWLSDLGEIYSGSYLAYIYIYVYIYIADDDQVWWFQTCFRCFVPSLEQ